MKELKGMGESGKSEEPASPPAPYSFIRFVIIFEVKAIRFAIVRIMTEHVTISLKQFD